LGLDGAEKYREAFKRRATLGLAAPLFRTKCSAHRSGVAWYGPSNVSTQAPVSTSFRTGERTDANRIVQCSGVRIQPGIGRIGIGAERDSSIDRIEPAAAARAFCFSLALASAARRAMAYGRSEGEPGVLHTVQN
jgi:hypothetical protein